MTQSPSEAAMAADRISQDSAQSSRVDPRASGLAQRIGLAGSWLAIAAALLCADGCWDSGPLGPEEEASGPIVSDPALVLSPSSSDAGFAAARAEVGGVVYVSLPPGTIPNGELVVIRRAGSETGVTAAMLDGGFDPVPVAAAAGDTLLLDIQASRIGGSVQEVLPVPEYRKPRVVRAYPPHKKRDVPLYTQVLIVFSEPIDPGTLSDQTVQLWRRVGPARDRVPGRVGVRDADRLAVEFAPTAPLVASASYDLVVTSGIRDLDGETLEAPLTAQFTTGTSVDTLSASLIAFTKTGEVYVMQADGSNVRRLTSSNGWGSDEPTWSPDGKKLAFASAMHRASGGSNDPSIYVMNADGSGRVRLTNDWWGSDGTPAWSPDGGRIAFSRGECLNFELVGPEPRCTANTGNSNGAIYVVKADGSGITRLARGHSPFWSPDGSRIAFVRFSGDQSSDIYVMNDDGSGVTKLTYTPGPRGRPTWSPDGLRIAFTGQADAITPGDIYVMNSDGSGLIKLTSGGPYGGGESPSWSPDGSKIVFRRNTSFSSPGLFVVNTSGTPAVTDLHVEGRAPAWSPSGRVAPPRPVPATWLRMAADANGDGQAGVVGSTLAEPFRVQVLRDGVPAPGVEVEWAIWGDGQDFNPEGSSLSTDTATTDAQGIAATTLTLGLKSRGYVIGATVAGAGGSPVVFGASAVPETGVALAKLPAWGAGDSQVGLPGQKLGAYQVKVVDRWGNTVEGVKIDWAVVSGRGTVTPLQTRSGTVWTVAYHTLGPEVGPQTVTAIAAVPGAPQASFTSSAADAVIDIGWSAGGACISSDPGLFPAHITVPRGSTVGWRWVWCDLDGDGTGPSHNVVFEDAPTQPVSSPVKNSGHHLRTFTAPGIYRYRCTLHSSSDSNWEVGTVTVLP